MVPDDKSMPLPILLRVPWFPPDPAATSPEVQVAAEPAPRSFPLVVRSHVRASNSPLPGAGTARRKRWIVVLLLVAGLIGMAMAWHGWPGDFGGRSGSAGSMSEANLEKSPKLGGGTTSPRAAYLCPEIIPLDSGETP
jgi:hypothetical protein